jgi:Zn-dependent peptidase ImmA (M78 family)
MENKYKELNKKSPKQAAEIVGNVEKYNYLAHSIREIEFAILKLKSKNYHIITYATTMDTKKSKIAFYDKCCIIRLPYEHDDMSDQKIRLLLAHELGHLVFNFEDLTNPEKLVNTATSNEEELFAWEFAFHLINMKSEEHKNNIARHKFIYDNRDLKKMLSAIVKDKKPEIHEDIAQSLNIPKGL